MSGWVLSYVKGINADGTYRLNTKKSADPRLIRALLVDKAPHRRPPLVSTQNRVHQFVTPLVVVGSHVSGQSFDLKQYKGEIFGSLGIRPSSTLSKMTGFTGGQNAGIWVVPNQYCLKVVVSGRKYDSIPSERENYMDLLCRFPAIIDDKNLCFPIKIFTISNLFDVIVMPMARGDRMAELVGRTRALDDWPKLQLVFRSVGRQLRRFHTTYRSTQHGDLQTSNIFVDVDATVTLIDLGGMGMKGLGKTDIEYFLESIKLLAKTYGPEFERVSTAAFLEGYAQPGD